MPKARREKKAGTVRTRPRQMQILVAAMEANPYLNGKKLSSASYSHQDFQRDWEELKVKLNSSGGASKEVDGWQKTWYDKKSNVKGRAREYNVELQKTGGGEIDPSKELDPLEIRISALIGPDAIAGHNVEEGKADVGGSLMNGSNIVRVDSEILLESTDMDDISELLGMTAQGMADPPSNVEATYRTTPADVVQSTPGSSRCPEPCSTPESSRCPEPCSTPGSSRSAEHLPTLGQRSTEPRLRPFHRRLRTKNMVLKNSSANGICDGSAAIAKAFNRCAAALEMANDLEEIERERRAAHNAALIDLKKQKVDALTKIADSLNKK